MCLPNGLSSGPKEFTKVLNPVLAKLREQGHTVSGYLDDIFVVADSVQECSASINATIKLLESLGFIINREKSVFTATQEIQHIWDL